MHSATLGKGKSDDTLIKIRKGDLTGKGEVAMVFGKQASWTIPVSSLLAHPHFFTFDTRLTKFPAK